MLSKRQPARLKNRVPIKTAVLLSHIYIRYFIALTLQHLIYIINNLRDVQAKVLYLPLSGEGVFWQRLGR